MKKELLVFFALVLCCAAPAAEKNTAAAPHWFRNVRIVKVNIPNDVNNKKLSADLEKLRKNGVNTILDHGSFQFLPGLPSHGKAQWALPVDYRTALPFSQAVKAAGMRLIHHTTSTFIPIEAMQKKEYQDWFNLDLNSGRIALRGKGKSYADAVFADMNHPDFRKLLFQRMLEYAVKCNTDGFQTDEVEWLPDIYASGSANGSHKLYKERYGKAMPRGKFDPEDPEWRRYLYFRYASGGEFYKALAAELLKANKNMLVSGCLAGISKPWRRVWAQGHSDWLAGWNVGFFEMEEGGHPLGKRCGYMGSSYYPTYYREMALYNAYAELYNWYGNYAIGYPSSWQVKDSEQFLLWSMSLLMGFRYEMRDYQAETEWFAWEAKHEKDLIGPRQVSNIGIFFPEKERDYRLKPEIAFENWAGLSEALAREYIVADQITAKHFEKPELLKRFELIVLPAESFITPDMTAALKKFVRHGGILLVAGCPDTQDPFSGKLQKNELLELLGVEAYLDEYSSKAAAARIKKELPQLQGRVVVVNAPGFRKVKPARGTKVAAYSGKIPAVMINNYGKGKVITVPSEWGRRLYSKQLQRGAKFVQTADFSQHRMLADLVRSLVQPVAELKNMPPKFMFNVYDTSGHDDGRSRRTIHFLDCFDGYEKGEAISMQKRPCRFKQLAERNGNKDVVITVNNFSGLQSVKLLSPDFPEAKTLEFVPGNRSGSWLITVPAKAFGRYSIIVCTPTAAR